MIENIKLSFVIPCYRSENYISKVTYEIAEKMKERSEFCYEIILINDQSPDNVLTVAKTIASNDDKVRVIDLARNVGKHAALMAGYSLCLGDIVVCVDDDSQCPLDCLWDLLKPIIEDDYDVAIADYGVKAQSGLKNMGSYLNELMLRSLLDKPKELQVSNFFALKKFVCDEMIKYRNPYPYIIGLYMRSTSKIVNVPMKERAREDGKTGFTFKKSLSLWLDGFTAFSVKPLRISTLCGFICSSGGLIYALVIIIRKILNPAMLVGYSSMMSIILFVGGMIMFMLGMIGEYIGRIYISINNSPQYVIKEIYTKENK